MTNKNERSKKVRKETTKRSEREAALFHRLVHEKCYAPVEQLVAPPAALARSVPALLESRVVVITGLHLLKYSIAGISASLRLFEAITNCFDLDVVGLHNAAEGRVARASMATATGLAALNERDLLVESLVEVA